MSKEVHIECVGGGSEGFPIFLKKIHSPGDHRPTYFLVQKFFSENISWPHLSILVSYLRLFRGSISG